MRRLIGFAIVLVTGCFQSVSIGYDDAGVPPDRVALEGRFCTSVPDRGAAAVKVVYLLDQSGSMCVTDPPAAQQNPSFCTQFLQALSQTRSLPVEPRGVTALKRHLFGLMDHPEVSVSIAPFASTVRYGWPGGGFRTVIEPKDLSEALIAVNMFQNQLGTASDVQGALEHARGLIADDISRTRMLAPERLPRTTYVVVLVSDGTPFPRCSAEDALPAPDWANPDLPDGVWPDSPGNETFCNQGSLPGMEIPGFVPGTSRNQNAQLFSEVDQLVGLAAANNVGAVRLDTMLLFNEESARVCGPLCQDVYGAFPPLAPADYLTAAKKVARWTMKELAAHGHGAYSELIDFAGIDAYSFPQDLTSPILGTSPRNIEKGFMLRPLTSVPGTSGREPDADGDGLADALETSTSTRNSDSDGDCFDDGFEVRHALEGFDPLVIDTRGCNPALPATMGCNCRDTDGDGLSQFAEQHLRTSVTNTDSDGDGVIDGVEVRWGLDPRRALTSSEDTDADGVSDAEEIRTGSDPTRHDAEFRATYAFRYSLAPQEMSDGSVCYDFAVENVQRTAGSNLFALDVAEIPRGTLPTDYGVWRRACASSELMPGAPSAKATLADTAFVAPQSRTGDPAAWREQCAVAE